MPTKQTNSGLSKEAEDALALMGAKLELTDGFYHAARTMCFILGEENGPYARPCDLKAMRERYLACFAALDKPVAEQNVSRILKCFEDAAHFVRKYEKLHGMEEEVARSMGYGAGKSSNEINRNHYRRGTKLWQVYEEAFAQGKAALNV